MTSTALRRDGAEIAPPPRRSPGLRSGALGVRGLFFCVATAAAPMTALLFNVPVIVSGSGWAAPAAFIVAAVALLIFSVGYVEMARTVTSAGGFYSFVSHGFGQAFGLGTAGLVTVSYAILSASIIGVFGYFANTTIDDWIGVAIPVWALMLGAIAVNLVFAWFDVRITARVLGTFFVLEVVGALIFSAVVLVQGGDHGLTAAPLNPFGSGLWDNHQALAVFGAAAPGIALFGAFWSWVGFESAPSYGEETSGSPRVFAIATYGTLLVLALVYVLASYAFVVGWGTDHVAQGVADQYAGKTASAFYPLTDRFAGAWLTNVFQALIVTSAFACQLAFFNTASRYVFALGRERILPSWFAVTHHRHASPHRASTVVAAFLALYVGGFLLDDSSTEAALVKLGTWSPLLGVLGILFVQSLVSFAIVRFFWRRDRGDGRPIRRLVLPSLGGLVMAGSAYLLISNRGTLAGDGHVPFVQLLPFVVLLVFVLGVALAVWFRLKDAPRYAAVGRFVHEEA